jgi:hypothetical protein
LDLPAFNFLDGYWRKLCFFLPVGIQLSQEVDEYASSNNWERQTQKEAGYDSECGCECFHQNSLVEPVSRFAAAHPLAEREQYANWKDEPDQ